MSEIRYHPPTDAIKMKPISDSPESNLSGNWFAFSIKKGRKRILALHNLGKSLTPNNNNPIVYCKHYYENGQIREMLRGICQKLFDSVQNS